MPMAVPLTNHCVELSPGRRGPSHQKVTVSIWNTLTHGGCKVITAFGGSALLGVDEKWIKKEGSEQLVRFCG